MSRKGADFERLARPIGNPTDGQVPAYRDSDGNMVWADAGGGPTNPDTNFAITSSGFDAPGTQSGTNLVFSNANRTVFLAPASGSFSYTYNGQRYEIDTILQHQIPDSEGLHYIWLEEDGNIFSSQTFDTSIITEKAFFAVAYWDATNNEALLFSDERHGNQMPPATHIYNHLTFGTRYESGLGLFDLDVDGSGNDTSTAQFGVESGRIWDEDITHAISTFAVSAEISIFYRSGSAWRRVEGSNLRGITAGAGQRIAWNEETSPGVWQLTETGNGDFICMHFFATSDPNQGIIGIVGQAEYATLGLSRDGAPNELFNLQYGQLDTLLPEFLPIATVIFQTSDAYGNDLKARIRSLEPTEDIDYVDWRQRAQPGGGSSSGGVGIPIGGETSYVLTKDSATDYDVSWRPPTPRLFRAIATGIPGGVGPGLTPAVFPYFTVSIAQDSGFSFNTSTDQLTCTLNGHRIRHRIQMKVNNCDDIISLYIGLRKNGSVIASIWNLVAYGDQIPIGGCALEWVDLVTTSAVYDVVVAFDRVAGGSCDWDPTGIEWTAGSLGDPP